MTPSRLPAEMQAAHLRLRAQSGARAGPHRRPVHAEFRVNEGGPWVLEAAPRPIGGLCSRVLRFGPERIFLEELLVRHAMGLARRGSGARTASRRRDDDSGAVERRSGERRRRGARRRRCRAWRRFRSPRGCTTSSPPGRRARAISDLFLPAAETPAEVEAALRRAHAALRFTITPRLPVAHPAGLAPDGVLHGARAWRQAKQ